MSSALLPVFQAVPVALRAKKTEMGREVLLLRKRQLPVLLAADWPVQLLVANSPQKLLAAQLIALLRDFFHSTCTFPETSAEICKRFLRTPPLSAIGFEIG